MVLKKFKTKWEKIILEAKTIIRKKDVSLVLVLDDISFSWGGKDESFLIDICKYLIYEFHFYTTRPLM